MGAGSIVFGRVSNTIQLYKHTSNKYLHIMREEGGGRRFNILWNNNTNDWTINYTLVSTMVWYTSFTNSILHSKELQYVRDTLMLLLWNCHHRKWTNHCTLPTSSFSRLWRKRTSTLSMPTEYISSRIINRDGRIVHQDNQLPLPPNYEPKDTTMKRSILLLLATIIQLTYCIISPSSSKYYDRL